MLAALPAAGNIYFLHSNFWESYCYPGKYAPTDSVSNTKSICEAVQSAAGFTMRRSFLLHERFRNQHQVYTGCNKRNGPDFGRVFLMLNYTEKPQNTYIQS